MADHDLTQELCKNLDRHLAFPLLEFLSNKELYSETDIQKAKIDLLQKTNMVDYAAEIYTALYKTDDVPEEMNSRRKEVVAKLKTLQVCSLHLDTIWVIVSQSSLLHSLRMCQVSVLMESDTCVF